MNAVGQGRAYCLGPVKRALDLATAALGLVLLSPVILALALAILVSSGRPIFYAQERIGRGGRPFRLLKLRTMRSGSERGLPITGKGDARVTPVGRFLRASKLDELPQLINVLSGDMSLVGPRPEVPRYVSTYGPAQRAVLDVRPGLTDPATVLFRNEEELLGRVEEGRREAYYVAELLPRKLSLNLAYIDDAGLRYDFILILRTLGIILRPHPS